MNKTIIIMNFLLLAALTSSCAQTRTYTLYRNSPMSADLRGHFATFDSDDGGSFNPFYNQGNCDMVIKLLNANVQAMIIQNGGDPSENKIGFWCEEGQYVEDGSTPSAFSAEFPVDGRDSPGISW